MIKPKALKQGDTVGVVAPSDAVEKEDVERGREILEKWGLKVKIGKHVYAKIGDFSAGTAEERMEDLKFMINEPEIKAVWAAGGGYAATEILPVFHKETIGFLQANPKWFLGYSDVCIILNALTSFRMASVMGPNLSGLSDWDKKSRETLRKTIFCEGSPDIPADAKWKPAITGEAEGRVVATNLELLILSLGTRFDPIMYGEGDIILALEELDIDKSQLQRQIDTILNHKRARRIKGVVVGRLVNIKEMAYPEWGKKVTAEGLIGLRMKKAGIPLAFCADFGHPEWSYGDFQEIKKYFSNRRFYPLANGIKAKLTVGEKECKLEYLESVCKVENEQ